MRAAAPNGGGGGVARGGGARRRKGAAGAEAEEARALALGERLKAWFAALSRQPVPKPLLDHVHELERGEDVSPPQAPLP